MKSIHLQLPAELLKRVDEACGDVPRNRWIRRAVERALSEEPSVASPSAERVLGTLPSKARSAAPAERPSRADAFRQATQRKTKR